MDQLQKELILDFGDWYYATYGQRADLSAEDLAGDSAAPAAGSLTPRVGVNGGGGSTSSPGGPMAGRPPPIHTSGSVMGTPPRAPAAAGRAAVNGSLPSPALSTASSSGGGSNAKATVRKQVS